MFISFLNSKVEIGSLQQLIPILIAVLFSVIIIWYSKSKLNNNQQDFLFKILGWIVSLTIVTFHVNKIVSGTYNFNTDLPLFLCTFMALTIPFFTQTKKYWLYEILLFWIIAGTSQAVITPDIPVGFPSFDFFRYWIAHLGLLVIIFYATFVFNMRPNFKSVIKSFLAIQVYMVFLLVLNYLLGANYSYLNRKPPSASVLDYLGDWPIYIFVVEAVLIPYFLIIYLPFFISKKLKKAI